MYLSGAKLAHPAHYVSSLHLLLNSFILLLSFNTKDFLKISLFLIIWIEKRSLLLLFHMSYSFVKEFLVKNYTHTT